MVPKPPQPYRYHYCLLASRNAHNTSSGSLQANVVQEAAQNSSAHQLLKLDEPQRKHTRVWQEYSAHELSVPSSLNAVIKDLQTSEDVFPWKE